MFPQLSDLPKEILVGSDEAFGVVFGSYLCLNFWDSKKCRNRRDQEPNGCKYCDEADVQPTFDGQLQESAGISITGNKT